MFEPVFIIHHGKQVLKADYTGVEARGLVEAFGKTERIVTAAAPRSIRILAVLRTDMRGVDVAALKRLSAANAPFVLAVAVVGNSFWRLVVSNIQADGRDNVQLFEKEDEALDWLATR
jgi:phosphoribosylanthranilate isomerase